MATTDGKMAKEVREALSEIGKMLAAHGGDIQLVDVEAGTGTVTVRLKGACAGCPMADATIKNLVEMTLRDRVPGVMKVVNSPE